MPQYNTPEYNTSEYNAEGASFFTEIERKRDSKPIVKVEFITVDGTAYDVTRYFESGAVIERVKERSPDEIQAGDFDIVFINHDDYFSEYKAASLLFGIQYHGALIRISAGFRLPDGTEEVYPQITGYIDELQAHPDESKVTFRCRDIIRTILDSKLHLRPDSETPAFGVTNVGDGDCSTVETRPFKTVNEDWVLTCNNPGSDTVATFTVVGSVSGSVGTATSGTEFSTGTGAGGIRFLIRAGATPWSINDTITFSTKQAPEWTLKNPAKIIWAVLTGYNWDTNTPEAWADLVFDFDHTQSSANTNIDYDAFVQAVDDLSAIAISGYAAYDDDPAEFLQGLLILFLGAFYTDGDGRIRLQTYVPRFVTPNREFADSKKITSLGYNRSVNEIINYVVVSFKVTNNWEFSGDEPILDGTYVTADDDSIDKYGDLGFDWESRWYSATGVHVEDFANRLLGKYADPPLVVTFDTGLDGIVSNLGDRISVTDTKYGFSAMGCEISSIRKDFDGRPNRISITARRDGDSDLQYGFLGSSADEGDGLSPQAAAYGSASETDKLFCYLGVAGDSAPNYLMF